MKRPPHGGEAAQGGPIRLDFSVNLNTTAPPIPRALWQRWQEAIRVYPPPTGREVEAHIARFLNADPAGVLATNGGNEALRIALETSGGARLLVPSPCFAEYPYFAQQIGMPWSEKRLPPEDWGKARAWLPDPVEDETVIMLANPNNPAGFLLPRDELAAAIQASVARGTRWIVDEAFVDFVPGGRENSLVPLLGELPNLAVADSFTKAWAIPGLRLGFLATAHPAWMQTARKEQITWPLHGLALPWVAHYLQPEEVAQMEASLAAFHSWRAYAQDALQTSTSLRPLPSTCNYFLVETPPGTSANALADALESQGILVRRCDAIPGMPPDRFVRLAVLPPEATDQLVAALKPLVPR